MTESTDTNRYGVRKDGLAKSKRSARRARTRQKRKSGTESVLSNPSMDSTVVAHEAPQPKASVNESSASMITPHHTPKPDGPPPAQQFTAINSPPPRKVPAATPTQHSRATAVPATQSGMNVTTTAGVRLGKELPEHIREWARRLPSPPRPRVPTPPPKLPYPSDDDSWSNSTDDENDV